MIGIYKFTNRYNRKCYIGKSVNIEDRYRRHLYNSKHGVVTYFYNALRKYGIDAFDFQVLIECPKENLNYWEKFYIRYYCSNNHDWGYNMTSGGDGIEATEEECKRRSEFAKTRIGIKNSFYGHNHSDETKRKISNKLTRIKTGNRFERTDEWKNKISEAHKGKIPWNKGISTTEEQKEKQRQKMKGRVPWNKGKKGLQIAWNKGVPITNEQREKQSQKMKGRVPWNKGLKISA